ncbi:hypothetical protein [Micromonospora sp. 4G55]|uniref:hypothetical protein n=1 Tax=Micromonospora sp. 4G55 TaxID=2806102 RepID=UPI001EE49288|nr:hypothetical protein [Micromonospora sp. 4G55]
MKVELLVVEDCPNEGLAAAVVRRALDEVGLSTVRIAVRVVTSEADAEQLGFVGSPSVLIDGRDPFAEAHHRPALACRLYRDDTGVSGVPPIRRLRQALRQAAEPPGSELPGLTGGLQLLDGHGRDRSCAEPALQVGHRTGQVVPPAR